MQNENTNHSSQEKDDRGPHQAKGCCLLLVSILVACGILILAGIACIIIVDSISLRGEDHSLSWRVERYKVACQFIWADFKEAVSRKFSESSPVELEIIQCPADPPESEPGSEPEQ